MRVSFREWEDTPLAHRAANALGQEEVQVWIATVPADEARVTTLAACLSSDEAERAARFLVEEPRRQFMFGRAVLRQVLGACLEVAPAAIVFGYEPHGKPFLCRPVLGRNLHFNLSHADRHVALALAYGRKVGIDIEGTQRGEDWLGLADQVFSPDELSAIQGLPASQRRAAFFKGWTSKEAYLKATGEGLGGGLSSVQVSVGPGTPPRFLALPGGLGRWAIHAVPMPAGWAGAVVFEEEGRGPFPVIRII